MGLNSSTTYFSIFLVKAIHEYRMFIIFLKMICFFLVFLHEHFNYSNDLELFIQTSQHYQIDPIKLGRHFIFRQPNAEKSLRKSYLKICDFSYHLPWVKLDRFDGLIYEANLARSCEEFMVGAIAWNSIGSNHFSVV